MPVTSSARRCRFPPARLKNPRSFVARAILRSVAYAIGLVLALGVLAFGRIARFDRDRAFYPTILMVVALYYVLFAVMSGSLRALIVESTVMIAFAIAAVAGFRRSLWIAAAGLLGHGVFDLVHPLLIANAGVPSWWPGFCMTYDIAAAGGLAWLLVRRRPSA